MEVSEAQSFRNFGEYRDAGLDVPVFDPRQCRFRDAGLCGQLVKTPTLGYPKAPEGTDLVGGHNAELSARVRQPQVTDSIIPKVANLRRQLYSCDDGKPLDG